MNKIKEMTEMNEMNGMTEDEMMNLIFTTIAEESLGLDTGSLSVVERDGEEFLSVPIEEGEAALIGTGRLQRVYDAGGLEATREMLRGTVANAMHCLPVSIIPDFLDFSKVKSRLTIRLKNIGRVNEDSHVFRTIGEDIAICPTLVIEESTEERWSSPVQIGYLALWGKTEDEIFEIAWKNYRKNEIPVLFFPLLSGMPKQALLSPDYKLPDGWAYPLPILSLTTKKEVNGASAALLPEVLQKLAELLGEDFYIAFLGDDMVAISPVSSTTVESIQESILGTMFSCSEDMDDDDIPFISPNPLLYKVATKELIPVAPEGSEYFG